LEYASPTWRFSLTAEAKTIDDVQRRVFHVIIGNVSYEEASQSHTRCPTDALNSVEHCLSKSLTIRAFFIASKA